MKFSKFCLGLFSNPNRHFTRKENFLLLESRPFVNFHKPLFNDDASILDLVDFRCRVKFELFYAIYYMYMLWYFIKQLQTHVV